MTNHAVRVNLQDKTSIPYTVPEIVYTSDFLMEYVDYAKTCL